MTTTRKITIAAAAAAIALTLAAYVLLILTPGTMEYTGCVIQCKVRNLLETGVIYPPITKNAPACTWPYNPLALIIFLAADVISGFNTKAVQLFSFSAYVAAAYVAGKTVEALTGKKSARIITPSLILPVITYVWYIIVPRTDAIAVLFTMVSLYFAVKKNDSAAIAAALLAFAAKQSFILTVPLTYALARKEPKKALALLAGYGALTLLFTAIPGYTQNVIEYARYSTLRPDRIPAAITSLYTIITLGGVPLAAGWLANHKSKLFPPSLALLAALILLSTKPGAAAYYYIPFVFYAAVVAGEYITKNAARKAVAALLVANLVIPVLFLQFAVTVHREAPAAAAELAALPRPILSDDACVSTLKYDWFLLKVFSEHGKFSFAWLNREIEQKKFPVVVLSEKTYKPPLSDRFPEDVYKEITDNYQYSTTIKLPGKTYYVFVPKKQGQSK